MMIRTYTTHQAAKNLLTSWLKGKCFMTYWECSEFEVRKQPHRRAEDMEIVEITIVLPD